ncbi:CotH kinase family protein [Ruminococcus flavefaciens]|uniref:Fn3 domain-containing protein n=1 Tax=Ruminococcus flavefaciens TaxID=1265 RepID=A0A315XTP4_RUMFL|nr:CotH kinase family protein [Ruminococcus flavefaciens]PWJ10235.1 Fn3 domain-containing protein [Ruminococcus flavefaciens]SSA51975.1 Lamin Tail Domain [Ruminococcus flavefaciens]
MIKRTAKRTAAGIMSLALLLGAAGMLPAPKAAAAGAVTINEVCPKNSTYPAPDGGLYDWIELYNGSGSAVDISGWGITDKEDTPYRFTIPSGTVLQAGERKIFFCDGTAGETNSSIAPFGLSTSGEVLTLTDASGSVASQVTFGDMAKDTSYGQYPDGSGEYFVLATTPGEANRAPEGSNAVRTPSFSAESGFYNSGFSLSIDVPEGTTVYYTLDGSDPTSSSERYTGPISVKDMTSEPNKLSARTDITAYTDILAPEEGVLKAAVVRATAVDAQGRTSDIITKTYFIGSTNVDKYKNMKVISLVTDPDNLFDYEKGIYVKGKVYDEQNGGGGWTMPGWGGQQDPGQQNPGQQIPGQQDPGQGWNPGAWGQQDPNQGQQQGWGNFNFGGAGDPVAMADEDGQQQGGWGGFDMGGGGFGGGGWGGGGMGDFAFMSQANYNQKGPEWERPANIEIFENGQSVVSQNVGIRTKGAASRAWAQKSFNVFARMDYGKSEVEYDLFEGKSTKEKNGKVIDKFDGFTIRNGGNDNMAGYFRDSVNQALVSDRNNMATQATSECILFIDGEFWGIYQLTEKYNSDYFKSHYGVKKNDVAFVKNGNLEEGTDSDLSDWNNLLNQISSADMTNEATYKQFCEKLDIQSYIDYFAAQIYWANHDWPGNNTAAWRAKTVDPENPYADGKWRMVLFDTEYSANLADKVNETGPTYNSFSQFGGGGGFAFGMGGGGLSGSFTSLMKNAEFKKQFELTFMDLANYNFDTKKTTAAINYYKGFKQQIVDTYARFPSSKNIHNAQTFDQDYQLLETFYNTRFGNVTSQMKNYMSLQGDLATVTVNNDGSKGSVKFNTINLDDSLSTWSGKYFTDYPVTVKAVAKEGYTFDHWEVTGANVDDTRSAEITVPVSEGVTIKAVYTAGAAQPVTTTTTTTTATTTTTTTTSTAVPTGMLKLGDANCDGTVELADAILIMQSLANPNKYTLTEQGKRNADVDKATEGLTSNDALKIQEFLLGKIKTLD